MAKSCPCGCGRELAVYNGNRELVCYRVWKTMPREVRVAVMSPISTTPERTAAARQVLEAAYAIRKRRELT